MQKPETEEPKRGFFSKLWGKSKSDPEEAAKEATSQIRKKLADAGPTTLSACSQIVAIAILHEYPMQPDFSVRKLAGLFVDQYKKPGWIPYSLMVGSGTPIESIHRENAGRMAASESNQILAEELATMVKPKLVGSCSAIAFSGDNQALGRTIFAVVAR